MEEFFDLPALVTIFSGFLGLVFRFAEGMFGIANGFAHKLQCLHHITAFLQNYSLKHAKPSFVVSNSAF